MPEIESPKLHNVKIFMTNPNGPPMGSNLDVEIDGKKLQGVLSFEYRAKGSGYPVLELQMIANVDIKTDAQVKANKISADGTMCYF